MSVAERTCGSGLSHPEPADKMARVLRRQRHNHRQEQHTRDHFPHRKHWVNHPLGAASLSTTPFDVCPRIVMQAYAAAGLSWPPAGRTPGGFIGSGLIHLDPYLVASSGGADVSGTPESATHELHRRSSPAGDWRTIRSENFYRSGTASVSNATSPHC